MQDREVMAEAHNAALVRRAVVEIWNRGKLDLADVLFAASYVNHAGLIPDFVHGPEAIKISVAFYRTAFPDFQITIDELTAKRDAVLLRWSVRGSAALADSASIATQDPLMGIIVSRCAGGQIVESWSQWDHAGVLAQLGIRSVRTKSIAGC
jgi:SnoaL-like polyketide cyclase